ncbi:transformer-2 protein homolog beta-like [Uranotaenia lowii]|uniref:transformer-2 protein homolog beta-like n=1 Tax=Uranotaenia lowii TaxID=190385 RepID=UPI00247ABDAA|nr:transformer-2 protein homolog beta-like [Uranotaenia lowii]XP_055597582.1 transformer-2 protein homolog beta-like [Uranotaenia lowii]
MLFRPLIFFTLQKNFLEVGQSFELIMARSRSRVRTPPRSYRRHRSRSSSCYRKNSRRHGSGRHTSSRKRRRSVNSPSSISRSVSSTGSYNSPLKTRPVDPPASTCLGVFGLSHFTHESDLVNIFRQYGDLEKVMIVYDAKTKASRGFGFVYFREQEGATIAKEQCNGMTVHERSIRVDYSVTDRPHTPTPGIYMGERSKERTRVRSSYGYRGRSYDDEHDRSRRSYSRSPRRHRRHSSHRPRRHRRRSGTRSRSRSWSRDSRGSRRR